MANKREYKTALLITGDSKGGVKAVKLQADALEALEKQQLKGKTSAERWAQTQSRNTQIAREYAKSVDKTAASHAKGNSIAAGYAKSIGNVVKQIGLYLGVASLLAAVVLFPISSLNSAREFEKHLIGVSKTTDIVGSELQKLAEEVTNLSRRIPVTTTELLELAQSAGQLGVKGSENILKFTETVAKLGRTTDLSGEAAATALARILNVLNEDISTVDILASVFVSLGNNVAATESEIANITTQIAQSTAVFGIASSEAAALGAAMASMGVRAELGGSSVGRTFQVISDAVSAGGTDLDKFAAQFGLIGVELAEAFTKDKVKGFTVFLQGVKNQGLAAGLALKSVGLGGQEIAKTIIPLANNIELYIETQRLANEELRKATALNKEFEVSLGTLDSQWLIFKNQVRASRNELADQFLPAITDALAAFNENEGFERTVDLIGQLAAALAVGGAVYLGLVAWAIGTAAVNASMLALGGVVFGMSSITIPAFIVSLKGVATASVLAAPAFTVILAAATAFAVGFVIAEPVAKWIADMEIWRQYILSLRGSFTKTLVNLQSSIAKALTFSLNPFSDMSAALDLLEQKRRREIKVINQVTNARRLAIVTGKEVAAAEAEAAEVAKKLAKANEIAAAAAVVLAESQQKLFDRIFPLKKLAREYAEDLKLLNKIYADKTGTQEYSAALKVLNEQYQKSKIAADTAGKANKILMDRLFPLKKLAKEYSDDIARLNVIYANQKGSDEYKSALKALTNQFAKSKKTVDAYTKSHSDLIDRLFPLKKIARDYAEEVAALDVIYSDRKGSDEYSIALRELNRQYDKSKQSVIDLRNEANPLAKEFERAIERIDDAFFDLFRSAFDGWDSFKKSIVNSAKDLVAQIAYQFAKQQFGFSAGGVASFFGNSASGSGGGGLVGGSGGGTGGFGGGGLLGSIGGSLMSALGVPSISEIVGIYNTSGYASQLAKAFGITSTPGIGSTTATVTSSAGTATASGPAVGGGIAIDYAQLAKGIGLSLAGGFVGTKVGGAVTGKNANSNIGASVGAAVGSIFPVIGTFLGASIGGFLDSAFGSRPRDPRFTIGPTNAAEREEFARKDVNKITNSAFGGVDFSSDKDLFGGSSAADIDSLFGFFDAIKEVENGIAAKLGQDSILDVSKRVAQQNVLFKKKSSNFSEFFVDRFNLIFDSIGGGVNIAFDKLTERMDPKVLLESIDSISQAAFELSDIYTALDTDSLSIAKRILDDVGQAQSEVSVHYKNSLFQLSEAVDVFDGTALAVIRLSDALKTQKASATVLAVAYGELNGTVASTIGSVIDNIQTSLLNPEELYNKRRDGISSLVGQLSGAIDPGEITALVSQISQLSATTFSSLDQGQQAAAASDFVGFLEEAKSIALGRTEYGLEALAKSQQVSQLTVTAEIEGLNQFLIGAAAIEQASQYLTDVAGIYGLQFSNAVTNFSGGINNFELNMTAAGREISIAAADFNRTIADYGGNANGFGYYVDEFGQKALSFSDQVDNFGNRTAIFIDKFGITTSVFDSIISGFGHSASDVQAALDVLPDEMDELLVQSLLGINGAAETFLQAARELGESKSELKISISAKEGGGVPYRGDEGSTGGVELDLEAIGVRLAELGPLGIGEINL